VVPKCEIFHRLDFHYFYTIQPDQGETAPAAVLPRGAGRSAPYVPPRRQAVENPGSGRRAGSPWHWAVLWGRCRASAGVSGTGAFRYRTGPLIPVLNGSGIFIFVHLKNGCTLHIHTASCGNGYTLHVHTAGGGKEYTLHIRRQLLMVLFLLYDIVSKIICKCRNARE
jgi:hypothetical protein